MWSFSHFLNPLKSIPKRFALRFEKIQNQIHDLRRQNEYFFFLLSQRDGESIEDTKRRVFLSLPKASGDLRLLQLGNNYILKKIKLIAERIKVDVFLDAGTLLGGVRHQGFIPWDDDIDVGMLRIDFPRFEAAIKEDPDLNIAYYYAPISKLKTIKVKFLNHECFWVDIWLFDFVSVQKTVEETWQATLQLGGKIQGCLNCEISKVLPNSLKTNIPISLPEIRQQVDECYQQLVNTTPWYGARDGDYLTVSIEFSPFFRAPLKLCPKEIFFPLNHDDVLFEGEYYPSPAQTDKRLAIQYGDWMAFPPQISSPHQNETGVLSREDYDLLRKHSIL